MQLPFSPKAILFDMDGVLLDSERGWRNYGANFWKDIGIAELPQSVHEQIYGIAVPDEYAIVKNAVGLTVSLDEYIAHYDKYSNEVYARSKLADDLEDTLQLLCEQKIKLAIVSASLSSWIQKFLQKLTTPNYFSDILSIAETPGLRSKPAPDGYQYMLRKLELNTDEALVIEDSNRGIKAAKAADLYTIATSEFIDADYTQENYNQTIGYLKELPKLLNL